MLGGTHQFFNGLVVTNNGVLAGAGTIVGPTTVLGTLVPAPERPSARLPSTVTWCSAVPRSCELPRDRQRRNHREREPHHRHARYVQLGRVGTGISPVVRLHGRAGEQWLGSGHDAKSCIWKPTVSRCQRRIGVVNVTSQPASHQSVCHVAKHCPTGAQADSSPNADPLGKGMSNTNQFMAGFNPTNAAAYLHIISIAKTNNNADIKVTYLGANGDSTYNGGPASRTNVLEFTTGTANGSYTNSFTSTGQTNILGGGTGLGVVTNMVDSGGATNKPSRFYRVRVMLP